MIYHYEQAALSDLNDRTKIDSPLDEWINLLLKNSTYNSLAPLSRAIKYILLFEEQKCIDDDINLKDCYYLLHNLFEGRSPKLLDGKTNNFLMNLLKQVAKELQQDDTKEAEKVLSSESLLKTLGQTKKTYVNSRKKARLDSKGTDSELDASVNPLQISKDLYSKQK